MATKFEPSQYAPLERLMAGRTPSQQSSSVRQTDRQQFYFSFQPNRVQKPVLWTTNGQASSTNSARQTEDSMTDTISFKLNDKPVRLKVDGDRPLLWVLRTDLGLTGTKYGCGEGHCGSCTVLLDQRATRSCLLKVRDVKGKEVVTIEGLAKDGELHPLQKAFMEHDGMQCGYCTPGMILTGVSLLKFNLQPTEQQINKGLEQNFCRCGAHVRIVQAIQQAAAEMKGTR
jgi:aerobic-type carbon monoxide dehydrogenase small subunit (CoxS/CutS family)